MMMIRMIMMMMMMMHTIETEGGNHDLNGLVQLIVDPVTSAGISNNKALYYVSLACILC